MTSLDLAPRALILDRFFEEADAMLSALSAAIDDRPAEELVRLMQSRSEHPAFYGRLRELSLSVSRGIGALLYMLARSRKARSIIKFGTSIGISSLNLVAALRNDGGGRLITSGCQASIARSHTIATAGGLIDLVEIRECDAAQTLSVDLPNTVDLLRLDGAKALYSEILCLPESRLEQVALSFANSARANHANVAHVRLLANGYVLESIGKDVELSMRCC